MSTAAALPAPMDERQRLTATLVISLLLHGLLILGVGFAVSEDAPLVPTLDVIFSQTSTPLTPTSWPRPTSRAAATTTPHSARATANRA